MGLLVHRAASLIQAAFLRRRAAYPAAAVSPAIPPISVLGSGTVLDGGCVGGTTTTGGGTTGGTTTNGGGTTGVTVEGGLTGGKNALADGIENANGANVRVAVGTSNFQRARAMAFSLPRLPGPCGSCLFLRLCGLPGFSQSRRRRGVPALPDLPRTP